MSAEQRTTWWPSIYRYEGRWWHGGFDRHGMLPEAWLIRELLWMLRHGKFYAGWNWPKLIFGIGRDWYDGPIWFAHLGICSVSLVID